MTSIHRKSILVIDDDAAMLRAVNKVLSAEGAVVTTASWAGEAMERLTDKTLRFDLVITDLRMPILSGHTILGAVATALPEVPVIITTAFGSPEIKAECLRKGAAAFLEKPLETQQLLEAIEQALSAEKPPSPGSSFGRGSLESGIHAKSCNQEGTSTAQSKLDMKAGAVMT
jgi:DNA-binding NtrC family response regulator